ncbi:MAG: 30S ribosome-binding factor RbfA [Chloroflexi bacterium]|nr:30S ribosome-binding factor RbfA [Chloroflexota bacterium]
MSRRTSRVNDLLREELSDLLLREVKDPRIGHGLLSITEVQVSPDLHRATVFVSHLGDVDERKEVLEGLTAAAHFLHTELMHRLKMRSVPELVFRWDPSIERGARLASLIAEVQRED